jgi:hypothetical protein
VVTLMVVGHKDSTGYVTNVPSKLGLFTNMNRPPKTEMYRPMAVILVSTSLRHLTTTTKSAQICKYHHQRF